MQSDEGVAEECGHETSDISSQVVNRTTSLAISKRKVGRHRSGHGQGEQCMVFLVRVENQGAKLMGQYDETTNVSTCRDSVHWKTGRSQADRLPALKVTELSIGEHFLIWRRRLGLDQKEAGKFLGMSRHSYGVWELSETKNKPSFFPDIGELFSYEKCFIFRRRAGWTIPMCAEHAGVSRYWFNLMELGKAAPDRLIMYWIENEG